MKPLLSVCVITYNHGKYIKECLESIVQQTTNFDVEIIVGDDCSTDNTRQEIKSVSDNFPEKFNLLFHPNNLGPENNPGSYNFFSVLKKARGKYIAICEGDDFWTDPQKLQTQVEYLESHLEAAGCFHDCIVIDQNSSNVGRKPFPPIEAFKFTFQDCLSQLTSGYATCSLMFRREVLKEPWPTWFLEKSCDEFLDLLITLKGELHFIEKEMCAYRVHNQGVWQGNNIIERKKDRLSRIKLLKDDKNIYQKHQKIINDRLLSISRDIFYDKGCTYFERWAHFLNILYLYFPNYQKAFIRDVANVAIGTYYGD